MFTGLVKEIGEVLEMQKNPEGVLFKIQSTYLIHEINIDDSVSVNGACQTVVEKGENYFCIQSVKTTLDKTNFGEFKVATSVNLELAMRANDRLGGHFVTGHVNGIAKVLALKNLGNNREITFKVEDDWAKYLIPEGSITLNGVSLTLANVRDDGSFIVSLIPHTLEKTNLGKLQVSDSVNVEYDILIKFVESLIFSRKSHNLPLDIQSFAKCLKNELPIQHN